MDKGWSAFTNADTLTSRCLCGGCHRCQRAGRADLEGRANRRSTNMEADMKAQFGLGGEFSDQDGEILDRCRKIMASKLKPPSLRRQWMVVFPAALALTVQIFDWSPIWGPIALGLASAVPFLFYDRHLRVRLWQVSDLALRLAERAGPSKIREQRPDPEFSPTSTADGPEPDSAPTPERSNE